MLHICPNQEKSKNQRNHWKELVVFRDNCNEPELTSYVDMLLRGLNTASGMRMHGEIEAFLDGYNVV